MHDMQGQIGLRKSFFLSSSWNRTGSLSGILYAISLAQDVYFDIHEAST
jgi:hypothetical protein